MADGFLHNRKVFGGGTAPEPVEEKDVCFWDYDGTLLHSYTIAEANALSALPALPTREGLTCQEWNHTLAQVQAADGILDVGATYITDDGATRLHFDFIEDASRAVTIGFSQSVANGVTINWGDGSAAYTLDGTGAKTTTHTYATSGRYTFSLLPAEGCTLTLKDTAGYPLFIINEAYYHVTGCNIGRNVDAIYMQTAGYVTDYITLPHGITTIDTSAISGAGIKSIVLPRSAQSVGGYGFNNCALMRVVSMPRGMASVGYLALGANKALRRIVLPPVSYVEGNVLSNCPGLRKVTLPDGITEIRASAFSGCYSLISVKFPASVTVLQESCFANCNGIRKLDFSDHTSVPSLENTNALPPSYRAYQILVPSSLYATWSADTNWATYASNMVAV